MIGLPRLFELISWTRVSIEGNNMYQLNLESIDLIDCQHLGCNPVFWCSIGVFYFQINQHRGALFLEQGIDHGGYSRVEIGPFGSVSTHIDQNKALT
jgi:hypothetical protein